MIVILAVGYLAGRHYIANMSFLSGVTAVKQQDFQTALKLTNNAIAMEPRYFKAYYIRASIHYALGNKKAAMRDLVICDNLVPDFAETRKMIKIIDYESRKK